MKQKNVKKDLDYYLNIAKSDILVYFIILIVLLIVILVICLKTKDYFSTILILFHLIFFAGRIKTYYNLKSLKQYVVNNNLIFTLGDILYWNEYNYLLTDNYFIYYKNKKT